MKARKESLSIRRIGLCWEATRAPHWTRKPQAWAAGVAQAGLQPSRCLGSASLRARHQSEKSIKTTQKQNPKSILSLVPKRDIHAEPVQNTYS
jgi:hypothetical protein